MGLAELKADAVLVRKRLSNLDASKIDVKLELAENILPLFEGLCDALKEDIGALAADVNEIGDMVDDLADQSSEVLHPETTAKIAGVLELGGLLAGELEQLLPKMDDLGKKRVRQLVKSYRQGALVIGEVIAEITMPLESAEQVAQDDPHDLEDDTGGDDDDADDDLAADGEV